MRARHMAVGLVAVVAAAVVAVVNLVPASASPDTVPDQSKSALSAAQVEAWRQPLASKMDTSSEGPIGGIAAGAESSQSASDPGEGNGSLGSPDQPAGW